MRRWVAAFAASCAWPAVAEAEPAIVYVPTQDVTLTPTGEGDCSGIGGQVHSAGGCANVPQQVATPPHPAAAALIDMLGESLDSYDVHVTSVRPPPYIAYTMLLANEDPAPTSMSFTCSSGGINCAGLKRNDIAMTRGPTTNCVAPELLQTALYALGRASGLEGVSDTSDVMHYVPDYSMAAVGFVDGCSPIVNQLGFNDKGNLIELPLECTSLDHSGCVNGQQNSHVDLLDRYGPRLVDREPPQFSALEPGDGAVVAVGSELVLDVEVSDADPVIGLQWTIISPIFGNQTVESGQISRCTNDLCDMEWPDAIPLKPTDSDWSFSVAGLPEGDYEVMLEAADFHGNVAEPVVMVVSIGDVPPPPATDTGADTSADTSGGPSNTTSTTSTTSVPPPASNGTDDGADDEGSVDGTGGSAMEGGALDQGCSCRSGSSPVPGGLLWGLLIAAGVARRRRATFPAVAGSGR